MGPKKKRKPGARRPEIQAKLDAACKVLEPLGDGDMIEHSRLEEAFGFRRYAGSRYYGMVMALRKIVKHDRSILLVPVTDEGYKIADTEGHFTVAQKRVKRGRRQFGWAHESVAILPNAKLNPEQIRRKSMSMDLIVRDQTSGLGRGKTDGLLESAEGPGPHA